MAHEGESFRTLNSQTVLRGQRLRSFIDLLYHLPSRILSLKYSLPGRISVGGDTLGTNVQLDSRIAVRRLLEPRAISSWKAVCCALAKAADLKDWADLAALPHATGWHTCLLSGKPCQRRTMDSNASTASQLDLSSVLANPAVFFFRIAKHEGGPGAADHAVCRACPPRWEPGAPPRWHCPRRSPHPRSIA